MTIQIYRLGWYQGTGGMLVVADSAAVTARQPACAPAFPGPVACPWTPTWRYQLPDTLLGGLYRIVVRAGKWTAGYPFVIRSRRSHQFMVVVPQFTWQAYNTFGGSNLYTKDPGTGWTVPQVSFERPYSGAPPSDSSAGSFIQPAISWLERLGYDIGYVSDVDLADPDLGGPTATAGYVFLGHDEYWTYSEFSNVLAARDAGTHLAFFGANNAYWNIRIDAGSITGERDGLITCYKRDAADPGAHNPHDVTTTFHSDPVDRPENQLYGIAYQALTAPGTSPDYVAQQPADSDVEGAAFLAAAGINPGDSLHIGAGREGDGPMDNGVSPSHLQILFRWTAPTTGTPPQTNAATFFRAGRAGVFASGTNYWSAYLDGTLANPKVQALSGAILQWMSAN